MIRSLLLLITICLAACSQETKIPKDILPTEKMQAVYWDYLQADAFANDFVRRDTTKDPNLENAKLQIQLFKLHKVSKEQFYKSYDFYVNHNELMKDMLDTMLVRHKDIVDTSNRTSLINKLDSIKKIPSKIVRDTAKIVAQ
jgi:hypothetical protein